MIKFYSLAAVLALAVDWPASATGLPPAKANLNSNLRLETQQQQTLSGTVTDTNGEPIIGASILVKGTNSGTITDLNGHFQLNVRPGATLVISYIGYKKVEVAAQANMKVSLAENNRELNEVVVVGYGTQKKVNLTGAVANVDVDKAIASRPITDVGKALQGITPA